MDDSASVMQQAQGLLEIMSNMFNSDPNLQEELKNDFGWHNLTVGLKTEDESLQKAIAFHEGEVQILDVIPEEVDCNIIFYRPQSLMDFLSATPEESFQLIMRGQVRFEGSMMSLGLWEYLLNLISKDDHQAAVEKQKEKLQKARQEFAPQEPPPEQDLKSRRQNRLQADSSEDPGVKYLQEPYLARYAFEDFPRLEKIYNERLQAKCEFTSEYGKLITDFHVDNGYEYDSEGNPWNPHLRKGSSLKYLLEKRKPLIRHEDLLGGTWTENPVLGGVARPFAEVSYMWGELNTCSTREYSPYHITPESIRLFHKYIFPYWRERSLHELWKKEFDNEIGPRIHEQFMAISFWATVSQSENNPGFEKVLKMGTRGLIDKIDAELANDSQADEEKQNTLRGMRFCLEGVNSYASNLSQKAAELAKNETDSQRKDELERISYNLSRVPEYPAQNLEEAVQSLVITLVCLGWETMDASISLGRLDQVLQPFFESDMEKLQTEEEQEAYIKYSLELLGCLYLHVASREIIAMDLGQLQNSASPPNTCITFGGVTSEGEDGVNDMTYLLLKVTEMLSLAHPNTHARYQPGVNSLTYLKRVAEVNYLTSATPAIHNDQAVIESLDSYGQWDIKDIRNWASTGCVEPSLPGTHAGTTSALEINLVAPLEMALHNGWHPVANWSLGPKTGKIENDEFANFEEFMEAFKEQCHFILGQGVTGNNELGEVFQRHHPHLLIGSLTDGCIENGREFLRGGAKYNSSGATLIGLSDVVDSLVVIKKMVFEEGLFSFPELKKAVDDNFENYPQIYALINNRASRFGSSDPETLEMARRVMKIVSDYFSTSIDYKGGRYTSGWWSMAHHVVYGKVTNALPSGRKAGEPFTPGLTPHPSASNSLLDNLRDVAGLEPRTMDNNIAFNVKVVPGMRDTHEEVVDNMMNYMKTYFEMGGMQLQFNAISSETLKDAMARPENYQDLMVRISGYLAYFTKIHYELQLELIRRAEYGLQ